MAGRLSAYLMLILMLAGTFLAALVAVPEPAGALEMDFTTTSDLLGEGGNRAILDGVSVEEGTVKLGTESYPITDMQWSDGNANGMVVDGNNIPKLDRASHWSQGAGYSSTGVYSHTAVWDRSNAQVLVYGGRSDSGSSSTISNALWAYDPGSRSWDQLASVDRAKFLHTAVWADSVGVMIVYGGITVDGQGHLYLLNETVVYSPATDQWGFMEPCPYGGRIFHTAVWDSDNNQMLVMGGTPDGNLSNSTGDLFYFRPSTNTWGRLASLQANQARGAAAACWDSQSEQMIVFGGRKSGNAMTSVWSYKPDTNSWTQRRNGPVDRWLHSMAWDPINNKAYSFGGMATNGAPSARLFKYSPLNDAWEQLEMAPDARYWTGFVWDSVHGMGLNFAGGAAGGLNPPVVSYNDVMTYRTEVPFVADGWLTSAIYDIGGILGVGNISWKPTEQPPACGAGAVRFQVASSDSISNPTDFVGPDGTPNTYFTDPSGTPVGDYHFGMSRIAYRMYFHTDDNTISPTMEEVNLEVFRYKTSGTYTSPVMDLVQNVSSLERVTYSSQLPQGANPHLVKVTVKIRTSPNADMSGASNWETVDEDDTSFTVPYGRFMQFQVELKTDPYARHTTPVFRSFHVEYNSPPTVVNGQIDSLEGNRDTWFSYTVTYSDVDNDEPAVHLVYIDDEPHEMASTDVDFTDGAVYRYQTKLDLGDHDYYFEYSDGKNLVRFPETGPLEGPTVLNLDPEPRIDLPSSGERFTPDEPIEFVGTSSSDPDGDKLGYRWVSSIDGELDTHDTFITRLSEGDHLITLELTDEWGATASTQITIKVKAYEPLLEIKDLYLDQTEPTEMDVVTVTAVVYNYGEVPAAPAIIEFLVDGEAVKTEEEIIDDGDRGTYSYQWTAAGSRVVIGARARWSYEGEPDSEMSRIVNVTANKVPDVNVELSAFTVKVGDPISFVNNGTSDANGDKLSFLWDFGDGQSSTEASVQHTYQNPGTYYVNVTVTDTRGGESKETFVVRVEKEDSDGSPGFATAAAAVALLSMAAFASGSRRRRRQ